jgi:tRNA-specific adenosine deaminase 3
VIRRILPGDGGVDLQHLRRFAKVGDVPRVVRKAFERARGDSVVFGEEIVGLREFVSAGDGIVDGLEDLRSCTPLVDVSKYAGGAVKTESGKMVGDGEIHASNNSKAAQEALVAISEGSTSKSASPSAQSKSESLALSPQTELAVVLDNHTTPASTQSSSRISSEDMTSKELFLIVGSTNAISHAAAAEELSAEVNNVTIFSIQVPRLAPTSQEQAVLWSSQYWPTVYKKSNPFGPHPSIVSKAEQEIRRDIEKWINLASEVAQQAVVSASGERVGVVIVERKNGVGRQIAVAGDARWEGWRRNGTGNVTAHAAMRAIAMVAARLKIIDEAEQSTSTTLVLATHPEVETIPAERMIKDGEVIRNKKADTDGAFMYARDEKQARNHSKVVSSNDANNIFQDKPLLAAEKDRHDESGTEARYLCHDLEIYCTHEPCVMCSMAIVHSRFGRTVFQHRMRNTGGMCADGHLGHGLFWRKELNWTLMAWQWLPSRDDQKIELADFHA